jgi:hypothetical protein
MKTREVRMGKDREEKKRKMAKIKVKIGNCINKRGKKKSKCKMLKKKV